MREADRVVVVGYSMPFTDVHTEKMLSRCISANAKLPNIEIVNPDPSIADRFARITNTRKLTWYRDLKHFDP